MPPAEWTFFTYLAADNNLAGAAVADLREMERVGSLPGRMNVVALVDGNHVYSPELPSGTRLLYIERGRSREVPVDPSSPLGRLLSQGEANMGDPAVLRAAIAHVQRELPSAHFFLNLWDHGNAWRKIAADDTSRDAIDIARGELSAALSGLRIDGIAADACLTATAEVAELAASLGARTLVASEETVPFDGFDYADLLARLRDRLESGGLSARDVGWAAVDSYAARGEETLSATDLAKVPALRRDLDAFCDALSSAGGLKHEGIRSCYTGALRFAVHEQVDLGDFARRVAERFPGTDLAGAARRLIATLEDACYARTGQPARYSAARGLSIFAPTHPARFSSERPWEPLSVDPAYTGGGMPWAGSRWVSFLKTLDTLPRPPSPPVPPPSPALTPLSGPPAQGDWHMNLITTVRSVTPVPERPAVHLSGRLISAGWRFHAKTEVDAASHSVLVRLDAYRPANAPEIERPQPFELEVPIPVARDGRPWTVRVIDDKWVDHHLGSTIWQ